MDVIQQGLSLENHPFLCLCLDSCYGDAAICRFSVFRSCHAHCRPRQQSTRRKRSNDGMRFGENSCCIEFQTPKLFVRLTSTETSIMRLMN